MIERVVAPSHEDIKPIFTPRGHRGARRQVAAQRVVADPGVVGPRHLPQLVIGATDEDVQPVRTPCDRSGAAGDGRPKIIWRIPELAVVRLMEQSLAGSLSKHV